MLFINTLISVFLTWILEAITAFLQVFIPVAAFFLSALTSSFGSLSSLLTVMELAASFFQIICSLEFKVLFLLDRALTKLTFLKLTVAAPHSIL